MLTLLARETPDAELRLLFERADTGATGDDRDRPSVAFTFANPRLSDSLITQASFALDGKPVAAPHALTSYGGTRLKISMTDPRTPATVRGKAIFSRDLVAAGEITLTLLDARRHSVAELHFDTGPALAAARKALAAANWSCAEAAPAPSPAARWAPLD